MELTRTININMEDYGMTGLVVMEKPRFSKRNELRNQLGSRLRARKGANGDADIQSDCAGDVQILGLLAYIRSAPFPITLQGFIDYCDQIDEVTYDGSERFFEEVQSVVKRIDDGELSPFSTSPTPEKETSE